MATIAAGASGAVGPASAGHEADRIAFTAGAPADRQLFTVRADGSGRRQLTSPPPDSRGDTEPRWSPDGGSIAFLRLGPAREDGDQDVVVIGSDGSGERRLTDQASPPAPTGRQTARPWPSASTPRRGS